MKHTWLLFIPVYSNISSLADQHVGFNIIQTLVFKDPLYAALSFSFIENWKLFFVPEINHTIFKALVCLKVTCSKDFYLFEMKTMNFHLKLQI